MEDLILFKDKTHLIGTDEVGRGPLAGPVVSSACGIRSDEKFKETIIRLGELGVTDSKKLTEKKRKKILEALEIDWANLKVNEVSQTKFNGTQIEFFISEISPRVIEEINILQASLYAMKESVLALSVVGENGLVLVDGNKAPDIKLKNYQILTLVKGDSRSIIIGLSSIIAKIYRDELMKDLDQVYPNYGLGKHAGYPTQFHLEAIRKHGICEIHRRTFKGVKEFL
jgi:ribonuclease HII